jgi:putative glutathione S-transferase
MDCLCCADGGAGPSSNDANGQQNEFLGSICRLTTPDGVPAKFPVEPNRYVLYVVAGCPFAARPWALVSLYGLPIQVVKLFPASYSDGWFFEPKSDGEHELVRNFPTAQTDPDPLQHTHLKGLYHKANPEFQGAISVPLLWDTQQQTAVSNSSLGLAEMMDTQLKEGLATRNQHLELFPSDPASRQEHLTFCKWLHANVTTAVYQLNATKDGAKHDELVEAYYQALHVVQDRLLQHDANANTPNQSFLFGSQVRFCDVILWISLIRLDLAYQWRFGLGKYNIRDDYPRLQTYVEQLMDIEGMKETVFPRDIMALYFMTLKWTENGNGRSLPQVPHAWERKIGLKKEEESNGNAKKGF